MFSLFFFQHDSWLTNAVSAAKTAWITFRLGAKPSRFRDSRLLSQKVGAYTFLGLKRGNPRQWRRVAQELVVGVLVLRTETLWRCPLVCVWMQKGISVSQAAPGGEKGNVSPRGDICLSKYTLSQRFTSRRCVFSQREAKFREISRNHPIFSTKKTIFNSLLEMKIRIDKRS